MGHNATRQVRFPSLRIHSTCSGMIILNHFEKYGAQCNKAGYLSITQNSLYLLRDDHTYTRMPFNTFTTCVEPFFDIHIWIAHAGGVKEKI